MVLARLLGGFALLLIASCGGGGGGGAGGGGNANGTASTADLSASVSTPTSQIASGANLTFDVVLSNVGTDTLRNVRASLVLADGLSQGTVVNCTAAGGARCPDGATQLDLPGNSSLHFQLNAKLNLGVRGPLTSTLEAQADNDAVASNNRAQVTVNALSPDIAVVATGSPSATSGGSIAYNVEVSNLGLDAASQVALTTQTDFGQTLGSMTCTASAGAACPDVLGAKMNLPTLAPGSKLTFSLNSAVSSTAVGYLNATFSASAAGDSVANNNSATVATLVLPPNATGTLIQLQSDAGDYVGMGKSYAYSPANADISVSSSGAYMSLIIRGNQTWSFTFLGPSTATKLEVANYPRVSRIGTPGSVEGGMDFSGEGRGCGVVLGTVNITDVTYSNGALTAFELQFAQWCDGSGSAMRGQIRWLAADNSPQRGPSNPVPADLWRAPASALPSSGNYVYFQSEPGDFVGRGKTQLYTQRNAKITMHAVGGEAQIDVLGDQASYGDFQTMRPLEKFAVGYYGGLRGASGYSPAFGGMSWILDGASCIDTDGWFVVDQASYVGSELDTLDARFEQRCNGATAPLHGQIHWTRNDPTQPPGPTYPVPAGLWQPPTGATPVSGNYIYLQSDSADYMGQGANKLYTPGAVSVSLSGTDATAKLVVDGFAGWNGFFVGMSSITQLSVGYYPNLHGWPNFNTAYGGMSWSGYSRGCNTLTGWFVIDSITYTGGNITALDLRFEQHCEGGAAALRGKIHWSN